MAFRKFLASLGFGNKNSSNLYSQRLEQLENDLKITEQGLQALDSGGGLTEAQNTHVNHFPRFLNLINTLVAEINDSKVPASVNQRANRLNLRAQIIENRIVSHLAIAAIQDHVFSAVDPNFLLNHGGMQFFMTMEMISQNGLYSVVSDSQLQPPHSDDEKKIPTSTQRIFMQIYPHENDHYHALLIPLIETRLPTAAPIQRSATAPSFAPPPGPAANPTPPEPNQSGLRKFGR